MSTRSDDAENGDACCCAAWDSCLGAELKCGNFGLSHSNPKRFVTSQWPCLPGVYASYRVVVALYFVTWVVLSGVWKYDWAQSDSERIKWFIYLTNWSFLILTINVVFQAVLVIIAYGRTGEYNFSRTVGDGTNDAMPWHYKIAWLLHNVACNASVVTSLAFWTLIYKSGMDVHAVDWNTHFVNSAYVFVDTFITAIPLRLLHFIHGITFAVIYSIFSVVYNVLGQTDAFGRPYIYSALDWRNPQTAAIYAAIVSFLATPVVWLFLFLLYKIRHAIHRRIYHKSVSTTTNNR